MSKETMSKTLSELGSSQELGDGSERYSLRTGQQLDLFGTEVAHANPFRAPENKRATKTNGISGRNFTVSSASVALTQSSVSKLQAALDLNGSTEYRLIWKKQTLPSGRVIYRLRASARRISDKDCGGWPTTSATDGVRGGVVTEGMSLTQRVNMMRGWRSPVKGDADHGGPNQRDSSGALHLTAQAHQAGWPTCQARDWKGAADAEKRGLKMRTLDEATSGVMPSGTPAWTEKQGAYQTKTFQPSLRLNPLFSCCFLMGYPLYWGLCGVKASMKQKRK